MVAKCCDMPKYHELQRAGEGTSRIRRSMVARSAANMAAKTVAGRWPTWTLCRAPDRASAWAVGTWEAPDRTSAWA
eukprot:8303997-Alexandrium_andersonii.AAC.1